ASLSWSLEDLGHLVANLASCLPPNDLIKYNTMVEKLDWEKVRFGSYSAADCKDKWTQVMQKLRRYRTLTDLVIDARDWLKQPWPAGNSTAAGSRRPKHPDLPKKPMTPYFRFYHEKREKYSRENPDLSMTELAKLISKKFQELSDKKKLLRARQNRKAHPEVFADPPHKHPQAANSSPCPPDAVPEKPQTPVQLFTLDRLKKPDFSRKEAHDVIRKQWAALSDGKRLKWIRRSLQDQQRYEMEVAEYSQAYPGFKAASVKPILSKAEQEFKDKCDGKPERPPNSGYSLFSRIMLRQLKNVPAKEKMAEISRLWKALGQGERDSYNKQATRANAKYKEKYAAYLSNLPEEERHKLEADGTSTKSGGTAAGAPPPGGQQTQQERPKPKKPLSAMFFFQQEKVSGMKERCPQLSHQEVMRALAREFSELSDRKKVGSSVQYADLEPQEQALQRGTQEATSVRNLTPSPRQTKLFSYRQAVVLAFLCQLVDVDPKHRMAEIAKRWNVMSDAEKETYKRKVQDQQRKYAKELSRFLEMSVDLMRDYDRRRRFFCRSGYGVFSTEMLSQLVDVDPKHRMAEIAKRWNVMSDAEKETYKRKVQDQQRKYAKELSRFLENLTPEERLEYEALRSSRARSKSRAARRLPQEQRAPSSGSSSDDSSDEDEDDEEEEEDEEEEAKNSDKSEEASDSSSEADSDSGSSESSSSDEEEEENTAEEESSDSDNEESSSDSSDDDSNESGSDSKD
ncbi:high mobility group protein, putative, partial [Ixodes scapularis]